MIDLESLRRAKEIMDSQELPDKPMMYCANGRIYDSENKQDMKDLAELILLDEGQADG